MKYLRTLGLLAGLICASCETIPGQPEPSIWDCVIVNIDKARCVHTMDENTVIEKPIAEVLGWSLTSPRGRGDIALHHEFLHDRIRKLSAELKDARAKQKKAASP
jgi:hypothetical protein